MIVIGSRTFGAFEWHSEQLDDVLGAIPPSAVIVHGACPTGADAMAHDWAIEHGHTVETFVAPWGEHGKKAGPIRNQAMVDAGADLCVAFWDRRSPGTRDCITRARRASIRVQVYPHGAGSASGRTLPLPFDR